MYIIPNKDVGGLQIAARWFFNKLEFIIHLAAIPPSAPHL
jgi:hypothetical protein